MKVEAWGHTDVGLRRESNQDSYLIDNDLGLFIVADGMGGHRGGEVASALAVQTIKEVIKENRLLKNPLGPRELLASSYREASTRIFRVSQEQDNLRGMGTTMVTVLRHEDSLFIGNVGDSRAYILLPQGFWQVTEDHSLLYEHLKAGLIKEKDAPHFFSKNVITRSVGFEPEVNCDILERKPERGEVLLLCSDGLSGLVNDRRIAEICLQSAPSEMAKILIEEAKRNGGDDNVTALLIQVT